MTAAGGLAERTSRKLVSEEKLIGTYSGVRIRMDLDRRGLWSERGDIAVHQLWESYARFGHMPRLAGRDVLNRAIADRDSTITWLADTFAYAEDHDGQQWVGLITDKAATPEPSGLLIHPDRIPEPAAQPDPVASGPSDDGEGSPPDGEPPDGQEPSETESTKPTQFYAQFDLDPVRCIKQLGEIAAHVSSTLGDDVELVLEIRANRDDGFDESIRRTVSENSNALGARSSEFE